MPAVVVEKNSLASKYAADALFASIYTADPGITGTATGEVTGGAPAYARISLTWGAPSSGVITATATFNVPAGVTVAFAAVNTSGTAGTADVRDRVAVTSQAFASQGTYALTLTFTEL